jgi:drug/metabolite transporter (DMT)-like permease
MKAASGRSYFIGGIIICLIGSVCFSTKAIFVKLAYRDTEVDTITLLALRMIFSLPFFLISAAVASAKTANVRFTGKEWIAVAFIGCLGYYISSLLDFLGLQYVSAGIERLILFIYPTIVIMISSVIFKEKVKGFQWIALIITYAGLIVAFFGETSPGDSPNSKFYFGSVMIFLCAITYAVYIVGSGRMIPAIGAAKFNSYAMSFACIAVLIHFFIASDQSLLHLSSRVYVYSICMALLSTVIPSYLVTEGIKRIGSDNAAIVASVGPVSTIIQAYFFLNESIHFAQIFGTVLILIGVLIISRGKEISSSTKRVLS